MRAGRAGTPSFFYLLSREFPGRTHLHDQRSYDPVWVAQFPTCREVVPRHPIALHIKGMLSILTLYHGTAVLKWPLLLPAAHRYLSYALNPDYIRKQDATSTIISIASNAAGQTLAWDFVRSNWKKLFEE